MNLLIIICICFAVLPANGLPMNPVDDQPQPGPHVEAPKKVAYHGLNNQPADEHSARQLPTSHDPPKQQQQQQQAPPQPAQKQQQQQQQRQEQLTTSTSAAPPPPPQQQQQQQHDSKPQPVASKVESEHVSKTHVIAERSPVKKIQTENQGEDGDQEQQQMQQQPPRQNSVQTLANDPRCKADLDKIITQKGLCSKNVLTSNILILDCLQNNLTPETEDLLSPDCHQAVWDIKAHLTTDEAVHDTIRTQCDDVIDLLPECNTVAGHPGKLISCLIDHGDVVHDLEPKLTKQTVAAAEKYKNCNTLIVRLSSIVFGDYRLVEHFIEHCKNDITQFSCGRPSASQNAQRLTSQDETINCLRQHYRDINNKDCKREILRLAELQADDYHLNRALFYACRLDREAFCANVKSGQGRVYQCLVEHKSNENMTPECKAQLVNEQELAQEDYRIDVSFARKCNNDIQRYKCMKSPTEAGRVSNEVLMSDTIHCLVSAERDQQGSVSSDCMGAVHSVARQIMEDFKISPSIVSTCKDEIFTYCENNLDREGKTLQCLLKNAKKSKRNKASFSEGCLNELQDVLEEADIVQDYTVDPSLVQYCGPVIEENCKQFRKTGSAVLGCLLEHLGTPTLQEHPECAERVLALYYFVSRNWRLDNALYHSCKKEAVDRCGAKEDHKWHEGGNSRKDSSDTNSRIVLSCLYNSAVSAVRAKFQGEYRTFTKGCVQSISRVMRQRAMDVSLLPEIEDKCMADLAQHCSTQTGPGEEMRCLQESYSRVSEGCQEALRDIMRGSEALDLRIDEVLHKACHPMMEQFCSAELEKAANGEDEAAASVLDCLIKNKHHDEMQDACAVAIEHHQILQVSDTSLNPRFEAACKKDADRLCRNQHQSHKVLWCLSEAIRNDTLRGSGSFRVSSQCRERVRFEFFAEMDSVILDPELSSKCGSDIQRYCSVGDQKRRVFDCLKENWESLGFGCRGVLFQRVQMEALQGINVALRSRCERMMNRFCKDVQHHEVIDCLIESMAANSDFDHQCRQLVMRAQETKAKDVRLNPTLLMACSKDLMAHCSKHMPNPFSTLLDAGDIGNGNALFCLRQAYGNESVKLDDDCSREINRFIRQSRTNYKQDLLLAKKCSKEIEAYCSLPESQVEQCLREAFYDSARQVPNAKQLSHDCTYQIARLLDETKADVQTDNDLFTACQSDIIRFCGGPPGRGRVMGCLLSHADQRNSGLSPKCLAMVEMRREMWSYAAKEQPPESMGEIVNIVNDSPIRSTVLALLVMAVFISICIGVVCGRVTKRIRTDIKNR